MINELFDASVLIGIASSGIRLATLSLRRDWRDVRAAQRRTNSRGRHHADGAFSGFWAVYTTDSLLIGVLVALLVGLLMGLLTAFINVTLKAERGSAASASHLFGLGLSELLFHQSFDSVVTVSRFPRIRIPLLSDIPVIGEGSSSATICWCT